MNRQASAHAVAILLTLCGLLAGPAAAQTAEHRLSVMLVNSAGVPLNVVDGARTEVARIFSATGARVRWVPEIAEGGDGCLYVVIVSERMIAHSSIPVNALGTAVAGGTLARVIYERVERFARAQGNGVETALGLTIAHEVGHLLLPHAPHAVFGLMRAQWTIADSQLAASGQLLFTAVEADQIRTRLAGRD